jgi:hypothetical protein
MRISSDLVLERTPWLSSELARNQVLEPWIEIRSRNLDSSDWEVTPLARHIVILVTETSKYLMRKENEIRKRVAGIVTKC